MRKTVSDFREVFLVYCLQRQQDGSYLALNRRYVPVGSVSVEWVDYEGVTDRFKFKRGLTARQIAALSHNANTAPEAMYLYDDGCVPTSSAAAWEKYAERLGRYIERAEMVAMVMASPQPTARTSAKK